MDDKKKILLGDYDIISKDNEDLFLNVELQRTFSEVKQERHDIVFDVYKQWTKERNNSRDFRIYGIIDSNVVNTNNTTLVIYYDKDIEESNFKEIQTTSLVYGGYNVYGFKKGKFLLELQDYPYDFVHIKFLGDGVNTNDQFFTQQLVFRDAEQSIIDYGTQSIEIDDNGNTVTINNDFYFLYNKHWIKKDLIISKK